jgi:hypothetical protein
LLWFYRRSSAFIGGQKVLALFRERQISITQRENHRNFRALAGETYGSG